VTVGYGFKESKLFGEKIRKDLSRTADQSCIVCPEARAREFIVMARLILLRKKSERKRVPAVSF